MADQKQRRQKKGRIPIIGMNKYRTLDKTFTVLADNSESGKFSPKSPVLNQLSAPLSNQKENIHTTPSFDRCPSNEIKIQNQNEMLKTETRNRELSAVVEKENVDSKQNSKSSFTDYINLKIFKRGSYTLVHEQGEDGSQENSRKGDMNYNQNSKNCDGLKSRTKNKNVILRPGESTAINNSRDSGITTSNHLQKHVINKSKTRVDEFTDLRFAEKAKSNDFVSGVERRDSFKLGHGDKGESSFGFCRDGSERIMRVRKLSENENCSVITGFPSSVCDSTLGQAAPEVVKQPTGMIGKWGRSRSRIRKETSGTKIVEDGNLRVNEGEVPRRHKETSGAEIGDGNLKVQVGGLHGRQEETSGSNIVEEGGPGKRKKTSDTNIGEDGGNVKDARILGRNESDCLGQNFNKKDIEKQISENSCTSDSKSLRYSKIPGFQSQKRFQKQIPGSSEKPECLSGERGSENKIKMNSNDEQVNSEKSKISGIDKIKIADETSKVEDKRLLSPKSRIPEIGKMKIKKNTLQVTVAGKPPENPRTNESRQVKIDNMSVKSPGTEKHQKKSETTKIGRVKTVKPAKTVTTENPEASGIIEDRKIDLMKSGNTKIGRVKTAKPANSVTLESSEASGTEENGKINLMKSSDNETCRQVSRIAKFGSLPRYHPPPTKTCLTADIREVTGVGFCGNIPSDNEVNDEEAKYSRTDSHNSRLILTETNSGISDIKKQIQSVKQEVNGSQQKVKGGQLKVKGQLSGVKGQLLDVKGNQQEIICRQSERKYYQKPVKTKHSDANSNQQKVKSQLSDVKGHHSGVKGNPQKVRDQLSDAKGYICVNKNLGNSNKNYRSIRSVPINVPNDYMAQRDNKNNTYRIGNREEFNSLQIDQDGSYIRDEVKSNSARLANDLSASDKGEDNCGDVVPFINVINKCGDVAPLIARKDKRDDVSTLRKDTCGEVASLSKDKCGDVAPLSKSKDKCDDVRPLIKNKDKCGDVATSITRKDKCGDVAALSKDKCGDVAPLSTKRNKCSDVAPLTIGIDKCINGEDKCGDVASLSKEKFGDVAPLSKDNTEKDYRTSLDSIHRSADIDGSIHHFSEPTTLSINTPKPSVLSSSSAVKHRPDQHSSSTSSRTSVGISGVKETTTGTTTDAKRLSRRDIHSLTRSKNEIHVHDRLVSSGHSQPFHVGSNWSDSIGLVDINSVPCLPESSTDVSSRNVPQLREGIAEFQEQRTRNARVIPNKRIKDGRRDAVKARNKTSNMARGSTCGDFIPKFMDLTTPELIPKMENKGHGEGKKILDKSKSRLPKRDPSPKTVVKQGQSQTRVQERSGENKSPSRIPKRDSSSAIKPQHGNEDDKGSIPPTVKHSSPSRIPRRESSPRQIPCIPGNDPSFIHLQAESIVTLETTAPKPKSASPSRIPLRDASPRLKTDKDSLKSDKGSLNTEKGSFNTDKGIKIEKGTSKGDNSPSSLDGKTAKSSGEIGLNQFSEGREKANEDLKLKNKIIIAVKSPEKINQSLESSDLKIKKPTLITANSFEKNTQNLKGCERVGEDLDRQNEKSDHCQLRDKTYGSPNRPRKSNIPTPQCKQLKGFIGAGHNPLLCDKLIQQADVIAVPHPSPDPENNKPLLADDKEKSRGYIRYEGPSFPVGTRDISGTDALEKINDKFESKKPAEYYFSECDYLSNDIPSRASPEQPPTVADDTALTDYITCVGGTRGISDNKNVGYRQLSEFRFGSGDTESTHGCQNPANNGDRERKGGHQNHRLNINTSATKHRGDRSPTINIGDHESRSSNLLSTTRNLQTEGDHDSNRIGEQFSSGHLTVNDDNEYGFEEYKSSGAERPGRQVHQQNIYQTNDLNHDQSSGEIRQSSHVEIEPETQAVVSDVIVPRSDVECLRQGVTFAPKRDPKINRKQICTPGNTIPETKETRKQIQDSKIPTFSPSLKGHEKGAKIPRADDSVWDTCVHAAAATGGMDQKPKHTTRCKQESKKSNKCEIIKGNPRLERASKFTKKTNVESANRVGSVIRDPITTDKTGRESEALSGSIEHNSLNTRKQAKNQPPRDKPSRREDKLADVKDRESNGTIPRNTTLVACAYNHNDVITISRGPGVLNAAQDAPLPENADNKTIANTSTRQEQNENRIVGDKCREIIDKRPTNIGTFTTKSCSDKSDDDVEILDDITDRSDKKVYSNQKGKTLQTRQENGNVVSEKEIILPEEKRAVAKHVNNVSERESTVTKQTINFGGKASSRGESEVDYILGNIDCVLSSTKEVEKTGFDLHNAPEQFSISDQKDGVKEEEKREEFNSGSEIELGRREERNECQESSENGATVSKTLVKESEKVSQIDGSLKSGKEECNEKDNRSVEESERKKVRKEALKSPRKQSGSSPSRKTRSKLKERCEKSDGKSLVKKEVVGDKKEKKDELKVKEGVKEGKEESKSKEGEKERKEELSLKKSKLPLQTKTVNQNFKLSKQICESDDGSLERKPDGVEEISKTNLKPEERTCSQLDNKTLEEKNLSKKSGEGLKEVGNHLSENRETFKSESSSSSEFKSFLGTKKDNSACGVFLDNSESSSKNPPDNSEVIENNKSLLQSSNQIKEASNKSVIKSCEKTLKKSDKKAKDVSSKKGISKCSQESKSLTNNLKTVKRKKSELPLPHNQNLLATKKESNKNSNRSSFVAKTKETESSETSSHSPVNHAEQLKTNEVTVLLGDHKPVKLFTREEQLLCPTKQHSVKRENSEEVFHTGELRCASVTCAGKKDSGVVKVVCEGGDTEPGNKQFLCIQCFQRTSPDCQPRNPDLYPTDSSSWKRNPGFRHSGNTRRDSNPDVKIPDNSGNREEKQKLSPDNSSSDFVSGNRKEEPKLLSDNSSSDFVSSFRNEKPKLSPVSKNKQLNSSQPSALCVSDYKIYSNDSANRSKKPQQNTQINSVSEVICVRCARVSTLGVYSCENDLNNATVCETNSHSDVNPGKQDVKLLDSNLDVCEINSDHGYRGSIEGDNCDKHLDLVSNSSEKFSTECPILCSNDEKSELTKSQLGLLMFEGESLSQDSSDNSFVRDKKSEFSEKHSNFDSVEPDERESFSKSASEISDKYDASSEVDASAKLISTSGGKKFQVTEIDVTVGGGHIETGRRINSDEIVSRVSQDVHTLIGKRDLTPGERFEKDKDLSLHTLNRAVSHHSQSQRKNQPSVCKNEAKNNSDRITGSTHLSPQNRSKTTSNSEAALAKSFKRNSKSDVLGSDSENKDSSEVRDHREKDIGAALVDFYSDLDDSSILVLDGGVMKLVDSKDCVKLLVGEEGEGETGQGGIGHGTKDFQMEKCDRPVCGANEALNSWQLEPHRAERKMENSDRCQTQGQRRSIGQRSTTPSLTDRSLKVDRGRRSAEEKENKTGERTVSEGCKESGIMDDVNNSGLDRLSSQGYDANINDKNNSGQDRLSSQGYDGYHGDKNNTEKATKVTEVSSRSRKVRSPIKSPEVSPRQSKPWDSSPKHIRRNVVQSPSKRLENSPPCSRKSRSVQPFQKSVSVDERTSGEMSLLTKLDRLSRGLPIYDKKSPEIYRRAKSASPNMSERRRLGQSSPTRKKSDGAKDRHNFKRPTNVSICPSSSSTDSSSPENSRKFQKKSVVKSPLSPKKSPTSPRREREINDGPSRETESSKLKSRMKASSKSSEKEIHEGPKQKTESTKLKSKMKSAEKDTEERPTREAESSKLKSRSKSIERDTEEGPTETSKLKSKMKSIENNNEEGPSRETESSKLKSRSKSIERDTEEGPTETSKLKSAEKDNEEGPTRETESSKLKSRSKSIERDTEEGPTESSKLKSSSKSTVSRLPTKTSTFAKNSSCKDNSNSMNSMDKDKMILKSIPKSECSTSSNFKNSTSKDKTSSSSKDKTVPKSIPKSESSKTSSSKDKTIPKSIPKSENSTSISTKNSTSKDKTIPKSESSTSISSKSSSQKHKSTGSISSQCSTRESSVEDDRFSRSSETSLRSAISSKLSSISSTNGKSRMVKPSTSRSSSLCSTRENSVEDDRVSMVSDISLRSSLSNSSSRRDSKTEKNSPLNSSSKSDSKTEKLSEKTSKLNLSSKCSSKTEKMSGKTSPLKGKKEERTNNQTRSGEEEKYTPSTTRESSVESEVSVSSDISTISSVSTSRKSKQGTLGYDTTSRRSSKSSETSSRSVKAVAPSRVKSSRAKDGGLMKMDIMAAIDLQRRLREGSVESQVSDVSGVSTSSTSKVPLRSKTSRISSLQKPASKTSSTTTGPTPGKSIPKQAKDNQSKPTTSSKDSKVKQAPVSNSATNQISQTSVSTNQSSRASVSANQSSHTSDSTNQSSRAPASTNQNSRTLISANQKSQTAVSTNQVKGALTKEGPKPRSKIALAATKVIAVKRFENSAKNATKLSNKTSNISNNSVSKQSSDSKSITAKSSHPEKQKLKKSKMGIHSSKSTENLTKSQKDLLQLYSQLEDQDTSCLCSTNDEDGEEPSVRQSGEDLESETVPVGENGPTTSQRVQFDRPLSGNNGIGKLSGRGIDDFGNESQESVSEKRSDEEKDGDLSISTDAVGGIEEKLECFENELEEMGQECSLESGNVFDYDGSRQTKSPGRNTQELLQKMSSLKTNDPSEVKTTKSIPKPLKSRFDRSCPDRIPTKISNKKTGGLKTQRENKISKDREMEKEKREGEKRKKEVTEIEIERVKTEKETSTEIEKKVSTEGETDKEKREVEKEERQLKTELEKEIELEKREKNVTETELDKEKREIEKEKIENELSTETEEEKKTFDEIEGEKKRETVTEMEGETRDRIEKWDRENELSTETEEEKKTFDEMEGEKKKETFTEIETEKRGKELSTDVEKDKEKREIIKEKVISTGKGNREKRGKELFADIEKKKRKKELSTDRERKKEKQHTSHQTDRDSHQPAVSGISRTLSTDQEVQSKGIVDHQEDNKNPTDHPDTDQNKMKGSREPSGSSTPSVINDKEDEDVYKLVDVRPDGCYHSESVQEKSGHSINTDHYLQPAVDGTTFTNRPTELSLNQLSCEGSKTSRQQLDSDMDSDQLDGLDSHTQRVSIKSLKVSEQIDPENGFNVCEINEEFRNKDTTVAMDINKYEMREDTKDILTNGLAGAALDKFSLKGHHDEPEIPRVITRESEMHENQNTDNLFYEETADKDGIINMGDNKQGIINKHDDVVSSSRHKDIFVYSPSYQAMYTDELCNKTKIFNNISSSNGAADQRIPATDMLPCEHPLTLPPTVPCSSSDTNSLTHKDNVQSVKRLIVDLNDKVGIDDRGRERLDDGLSVDSDDQCVDDVLKCETDVNLDCRSRDKTRSASVKLFDSGDNRAVKRLIHTSRTCTNNSVEEESGDLEGQRKESRNLRTGFDESEKANWRQEGTFANNSVGEFEGQRKFSRHLRTGFDGSETNRREEGENNPGAKLDLTPGLLSGREIETHHPEVSSSSDKFLSKCFTGSVESQEFHDVCKDDIVTESQETLSPHTGVENLVCLSSRIPEDNFFKRETSTDLKTFVSSSSRIPDTEKNSFKRETTPNSSLKTFVSSSSRILDTEKDSLQRETSAKLEREKDGSEKRESRDITNIKCEIQADIAQEINTYSTVVNHNIHPSQSGGSLYIPATDSQFEDLQEYSSHSLQERENVRKVEPYLTNQECPESLLVKTETTVCENCSNADFVSTDGTESVKFSLSEKASDDGYVNSSNRGLLDTVIRENISSESQGEILDELEDDKVTCYNPTAGVYTSTHVNCVKQIGDEEKDGFNLDSDATETTSDGTTGVKSRKTIFSQFVSSDDNLRESLCEPFTEEVLGSVSSGVLEPNRENINSNLRTLFSDSVSSDPYHPDSKTDLNLVEDFDSQSENLDSNLLTFSSETLDIGSEEYSESGLENLDLNCEDLLDDNLDLNREEFLDISSVCENLDQTEEVSQNTSLDYGISDLGGEGCCETGLENLDLNCEDFLDTDSLGENLDHSREVSKTASVNYETSENSCDRSLEESEEISTSSDVDPFPNVCSSFCATMTTETGSGGIQAREAASSLMESFLNQAVKQNSSTEDGCIQLPGADLGLDNLPGNYGNKFISSTSSSQTQTRTVKTSSQISKKQIHKTRMFKTLGSADNSNHLTTTLQSSTTKQSEKISKLVVRDSKSVLTVSYSGNHISSHIQDGRLFAQDHGKGDSDFANLIENSSLKSCESQSVSGKNDNIKVTLKLSENQTVRGIDIQNTSRQTSENQNVSDIGNEKASLQTIENQTVSDGTILSPISVSDGRENAGSSNKEMCVCDKPASTEDKDVRVWKERDSCINSSAQKPDPNTFISSYQPQAILLRNSPQAKNEIPSLDDASESETISLQNSCHIKNEIPSLAVSSESKTILLQNFQQTKNEVNEIPSLADSRVSEPSKLKTHLSEDRNHKEKQGGQSLSSKPQTHSQINTFTGSAPRNQQRAASNWNRVKAQLPQFEAQKMTNCSRLKTSPSSPVGRIAQLRQCAEKFDQARCKQIKGSISPQLESRFRRVAKAVMIKSKTTATTTDNKQTDSRDGTEGEEAENMEIKQNNAGGGREKMRAREETGGRNEENIENQAGGSMRRLQEGEQTEFTMSRSERDLKISGETLLKTREQTNSKMSTREIKQTSDLNISEETMIKAGEQTNLKMSSREIIQPSDLKISEATMIKPGKETDSKMSTREIIQPCVLKISEVTLLKARKEINSKISGEDLRKDESSSSETRTRPFDLRMTESTEESDKVQKLSASDHKTKVISMATLTSSEKSHEEEEKVVKDGTKIQGTITKCPGNIKKKSQPQEKKIVSVSTMKVVKSDKEVVKKATMDKIPVKSSNTNKNISLQQVKKKVPKSATVVTVNLASSDDAGKIVKEVEVKDKCVSENSDSKEFSEIERAQSDQSEFPEVSISIPMDVKLETGGNDMDNSNSEIRRNQALVTNDDSQSKEMTQSLSDKKEVMFRSEQIVAQTNQTSNFLNIQEGNIQPMKEVIEKSVAIETVEVDSKLNNVTNDQTTDTKPTNLSVEQPVSINVKVQSSDHLSSDDGPKVQSSDVIMNQSTAGETDVKGQDSESANGSELDPEIEMARLKRFKATKLLWKKTVGQLINKAKTEQQDQSQLKVETEDDAKNRSGQGREKVSTIKRSLSERLTTPQRVTSPVTSPTPSRKYLWVKGEGGIWRKEYCDNLSERSLSPTPGCSRPRSVSPSPIPSPSPSNFSRADRPLSPVAPGSRGPKQENLATAAPRIKPEIVLSVESDSSKSLTCDDGGDDEMARRISEKRGVVIESKELIATSSLEEKSGIITVRQSGVESLEERSKIEDIKSKELPAIKTETLAEKSNVATMESKELPTVETVTEKSKVDAMESKELPTVEIVTEKSKIDAMESKEWPSIETRSLTDEDRGICEKQDLGERNEMIEVVVTHGQTISSTKTRSNSTLTGLPIKPDMEKLDKNSRLNNENIELGGGVIPGSSSQGWREMENRENNGAQRGIENRELCGVDCERSLKNRNSTIIPVSDPVREMENQGNNCEKLLKNRNSDCREKLVADEKFPGDKIPGSDIPDADLQTYSSPTIKTTQGSQQQDTTVLVKQQATLDPHWVKGHRGHVVSSSQDEDAEPTSKINKDEVSVACVCRDKDPSDNHEILTTNVSHSSRNVQNLELSEQGDFKSCEKLETTLKIEKGYSKTCVNLDSSSFKIEKGYSKTCETSESVPSRMEENFSTTSENFVSTVTEGSKNTNSKNETIFKDKNTLAPSDKISPRRSVSPDHENHKNKFLRHKPKIPDIVKSPEISSQVPGTPGEKPGNVWKGSVEYIVESPIVYKIPETDSEQEEGAKKHLDFKSDSKKHLDFKPDNKKQNIGLSKSLESKNVFSSNNKTITNKTQNIESSKLLESNKSVSKTNDKNIGQLKSLESKIVPTTNNQTIPNETQNIVVVPRRVKMPGPKKNLKLLTEGAVRCPSLVLEESYSDEELLDRAESNLSDHVAKSSTVNFVSRLDNSSHSSSESKVESNPEVRDGKVRPDFILMRKYCATFLYSYTLTISPLYPIKQNLTTLIF